MFNNIPFFDLSEVEDLFCEVHFGDVYRIQRAGFGYRIPDDIGIGDRPFRLYFFYAFFRTGEPVLLTGRQTHDQHQEQHIFQTHNFPIFNLRKSTKIVHIRQQ